MNIDINEVLAKLNSRQVDYLERQVEIVRLFEEGEFSYMCTYHKGVLRGYLECLCQAEVIKGREITPLYEHYVG
jgi:hypothetical protein